MKPIVLIHGYSAESDKTTKSSILESYGSLPKALQKEFGQPVVEINLARYISLEDGVTLDDVALALDRCLTSDFPHLLQSGFHAIVHSTGALVIRNWLRNFSPKPAPLDNLVYLAGANFGSGWAHVGKGQFAKWGRLLFKGEERGIRILDALELGSSWTIDLHRHFLAGGERMLEDYGVREHVIIGTQASEDWFEAPIRYVKEDGADGVVRVAASNLNFNYVRFAPTADARNISWKAANSDAGRHLRRSGRRSDHYEIAEASRPGDSGRPIVPFSIPYECAHSGDEAGIVRGDLPREQLMRLLGPALRSTAGNWASRRQLFDQETDKTYDLARDRQLAPRWARWISEPRKQYDGHSMVVLRLRDQDGRPVEHYDVFFDSIKGQSRGSLPVNKLMEHKHINKKTSNIIVFYMRTLAFDDGDWHARIPDVDGCYLEVTATEPETGEIMYLPFRFQFSREHLVNFIVPHQTTIIDIEMFRLPSDTVYMMKRR